VKLADVFGAREAWSRLSGLRLPPHTAYRLLKYAKQVTSEYEVIEQQRAKLIRDAAGVKDGEDARLNPGTPEFAAFVAEFGPVLDTESDLKPFDLTLATLLDLIAKDQGNVLAVQDLAQLEPFFKAETQPLKEREGG